VWQGEENTVQTRIEVAGEEREVFQQRGAELVAQLVEPDVHALGTRVHLSVTQRALSITQRALSVTQRALSVTHLERVQRGLAHRLPALRQRRVRAVKRQLSPAARRPGQGFNSAFHHSCSSSLRPFLCGYVGRCARADSYQSKPPVFMQRSDSSSSSSSSSVQSSPTSSSSSSSSSSAPQTPLTLRHRLWRSCDARVGQWRFRPVRVWKRGGCRTLRRAGIVLGRPRSARVHDPDSAQFATGPHAYVREPGANQRLHPRAPYTHQTHAPQCRCATTAAAAATHLVRKRPTRQDPQQHLHLPLAQSL
jgi:hypothetical protein